MKKTVMTLLVFAICLITLPLPAIGFGYDIFEIRTEPEFANGLFPSSLMYQFNLPMPGDSTILGLRLDNGLEYRTLRQRPDDGRFYSKELSEGSASVDGFAYGDNREYTVQFDEFNIILQQGVIWSAANNSNILNFRFSFDGRFENAFERLTWLTTSSESVGVFYSSVGNQRFPSSSWTGAPELSGNRSIFMLSVTAGIDVNYLNDRITRRDGIRFSSIFRYTPTGISILGSSTNISFMLIYNEFNVAKTLFSISQHGKRDTTWVSLVADDKFIYRALYGTAVPAYVQGGEIWGLQLPNTEHLFTNELSLTLYGPQINSYDCFPAVKVFIDIGLSTGDVLNTTIEDYSITEFASSYGVRASLVLFNIVECYFEYGYTLDAVFNDAKYTSTKFGVSMGYSF